MATILSTLTNTEFYNEFTNSEEINLALGKYDVIVKQLLPNLDALDANGLKQLIFSLEGLDRKEEALQILNEHPIAADNTDLMGLLAGRFKRSYLKTFDNTHGESALEYYSKSLEIATKQENHNQIYYHAINLAFLSVVLKNNESDMMKYAKIALEATSNCRDNLWKYATIGEANMYIGDMEKAEEFYLKAAKLVREQRNELWERVDAAFKAAKEKRFGPQEKENTNNKNSALGRIQKRYDGLVSALEIWKHSSKESFIDLRPNPPPR